MPIHFRCGVHQAIADQMLGFAVKHFGLDHLFVYVVYYVNIPRNYENYNGLIHEEL